MSHTKPILAVATAAALTASMPALAGEIQVIEFHNTILNHYFITNPTEAAMLDAGIRSSRSLKMEEVKTACWTIG